MDEYFGFVIPADTVQPLLTALNNMLDSDTLTDETVIMQVADFLISKESKLNKPAGSFIASLLTDIFYDDYKSEMLNIALDISRVRILAAVRSFDQRFAMSMIDRIKTVNHVVIVQTRKENLC